MTNVATADPRGALVKHVWILLQASISGFLTDEALTRGAAIAFYTITSIRPVLFIVVQVAGLFFGETAASGGMVTASGVFTEMQQALNVIWRHSPRRLR